MNNNYYLNITSRFLVTGIKDVRVIVKVLEGLRLQNPKELNYACNDEHFKKLVECWVKDPQNTPSFEDLYSYFEAKISQYS